MDGKIPDNFEEKLLQFFRDYLDQDGNVKPGREENLKAYIYFIDRILPSVNFEVNDYGPVARKNKRLSKCFTITDEAFALACVRNYRRRWDRLARKRQSKQAARSGNLSLLEGQVADHDHPPSWFYARWSGSHNGNTISGWAKEGIQEFEKHCTEIKRKRDDDVTGKMLEEYIMNYWKGTLKEKKKKAPKKRPYVVAFQEDDFNTKYAEV